MCLFAIYSNNILSFRTNRDWAVSFGRGLQAVNILRNHKEDKVERNVDFYPKGKLLGIINIFIYNN